MSTKIYTAYRTKQGVQLFDVIRSIQKQTTIATVDALETLVKELREAVDVKSEAFATLKKKYDNQTEEFVKTYMACELVEEQYKKQQTSPYRSYFNLDVSLSIHELDGRFYLIPYSDMKMRNVFDFLKNEQTVEDWAYWNNTDKPDNVTDGEWLERGRTWDEIHNRGWQTMLALDILNKNNWYLFNPLWNIRKDGNLDKEKILGMLKVA